MQLLPLIVGAFFYSVGTAQPTVSYSYRYYTTSQGLPSTEIICLAKDGDGFLWIGTAAGISKYDGYTFHNYAYAKFQELIGYVNVIRADADNRLWIGTGTGLFCLKDDEVIKISATTALPQGVNDILVDKNKLWLATENGPVQLNLQELDVTGQTKTMLTSYLLKQWTLKNKIPGQQQTELIGRAGDGTIFIAQSSRIFRLLDNRLDLIHTIGDGRDKINAIFPVSNTEIYYDGAASEICRVKDGIVSISGFANFYQPGLHADLPGVWYIGTRGAFYFHPSTGTASRYISFSDKYVVFPTNLLEDDHFIWLASHDGLIKLQPSIFTKYELTVPSNSIDYYAIAELKNGKILIGANRGKVLEKKGTIFGLFEDRLVPDAEVKALYEDERGWLWIASGYQGLALLRNGRKERYTVNDGLHDNSLYQFIKSDAGKFYVVGDQGMSEIMIGEKGQITFRKFLVMPNTTRYAKFFSALDAPGGTIWLGGEEGLFYLKGDSLQQFLPGNKQLVVNFMIRDKEGAVWIATAGEGILQCKFNSNNQPIIVKQYTENDGLNSQHYLALLADKENNIWAGSSKGISVIGRQGKFANRVINFDEVDGFIRPGYSYMRLLQAGDGKIWVITVFGFLSFNPDDLLPPIRTPLVYITGTRLLKSNQQLVNKRQAEGAEKNEFNYADNSLRFSFTALNYANQESLRYYYQLEGLDTAWKNAGTDRSVAFENLPPGKYIFRVKAVDGKGGWSKPGAMYAFSVIPPFWQTWWFWLLVVLVAVILLLLVLRNRISFIKKREAIKTELQKLKAAGYREQLEIEKIINHFATAMNSVNSIDDILWDVTKNCIAELNFEDCVIYLKDEERNVLVQKAAWGPKTNGEKKINNPIEIAIGTGIVGSVAETGRAEIIPDTAMDTRYIVDDLPRLSEIAVPIVNNGRVLGVIDSEHSQAGFYTERHLEILVTIASLCAGKIDVIKAEQQAREKEMEVLRLNKDFATSQLTALRMQMNPHFIFNALNSVQHFILQGNVVEANKYLSRFSKLQREILHCSNQPFITLEKEIEILGTYLQLEQFRFGDSFSYQLNMTDEIEPGEINIPPMMLQPFVENAIWHGLMPLSKERNLVIFFDLHTDDILLATIRDNGIGRAAAAKLKQQNSLGRVVNESRGMSMVQERLKLLQQQYDRPFDATIADITDINGVVQGTQVTLKIFIGNKQL